SVVETCFLLRSFERLEQRGINRRSDFFGIRSDLQRSNELEEG
uniref:Flavin reductase n=1 Tax=Schistosoma curassoni TaxID=6186 RepID=A0A183JBX0_9TREM